MKRRVRLDAMPCLQDYAWDLLHSPGMELQKSTPHHRETSTYTHSVAVARMCLRIAVFLRMPVEPKSLIRGALLHDYYLYNRREEKERYPHHIFIHAERAVQNAARDFMLADIEKDMIETHMFPLSRRIPRYRESILVCIADKICAVHELLAPETSAQEALAESYP